MKANVGSIDRAIRIVLGLLILAAGYYFKTWWGLVGFLPILTGAIRFCPGYLPFGINTCASKPESQPAQPPPAR